MPRPISLPFSATPVCHDPRLVRRYLGQTCLRLYGLILPLFVILLLLLLILAAYQVYRGSAGRALLDLAYGMFALLLPLALANSMVRQQLDKFADEGVSLSEELISHQVSRELLSPFDIFSSFDLCAEALSGLGTGQALCLPGPPAFAHDPFKRIIVLGRLRPFRLFGATEVRLWAEEDGVRIRVRRILSADVLLMQTGGALRAVVAVTAQLQSCLLRRQRAQEAAVREQLVERNALQARLSALQAQVEPHFLFNTLANLKYLQRTDTLAAQQMLDHLIGYLQNALPDMRAVSSTVGRELDLARDYLSIMQIRMGERLHFAIEAADDLRAVPMPPAMLISLVENALRHGLQGLPRPGSVRIRAGLEEGSLRVDVCDDGAGFNDSATHGHGLGLSNIQSRLALLYGDKAALEVLPQEPFGVLAILRLPLAKEKA